MSEEWSGSKSQPGPDQSEDQTQIDSSLPPGGDGGDSATNNGTDGAAVAAASGHPGARYPGPGGYPPPDFNPSVGGGMIPPPPVPPDAAAAAAAAAAVAGYPPMPHYQQPPWQPYGPPPPMGFPGIYPPYGSPYGPPPYQQGPPHIPPPHYYDPALAGQQPSPYEVPPGMGAAGYPPDDGGKDDDEDDDDDEKGNEIDEIGTYGAAARMKMYVKSKVPTRQEILDRRARKNAQSRARASKLRDRIGEIKDKPAAERTEEERGMLEQFESRRQRKNDRSRERAIEKKSEIDRILNKPERKRTKLEKQFLETALTAKQRKNEGDRLRRQRIKMMGKKGKVTGVQARPPYPAGDIPMSPLPPAHQYSASGGAYPGTYPSPRRAATASGALEAPGGTSNAAGGVPLPFIPPAQQYGDSQTSPEGRSQLHLPQNSSQVEQRRHPDGSMSISIGVSRGNEEMGDMSHLLLYGENASGEGEGEAEGGDQSHQEEV